MTTGPKIRPAYKAMPTNSLMQGDGNTAANSPAASSAASSAVLLIACGALAREITALIDINGWTHLHLACLPAKLHNTPQDIAEAVRRRIHQGREDGFSEILIAYGDCGTGGTLDAVLAEEKCERILGPHCYSFFTGNDAFAAQQEDEIACFYLTDFLTRHFDRLVYQALGLDRYPQLLGDYFKHYQKLVYLAQTKDEELCRRAEAAANRLGLRYEYRFTGYGDLNSFLMPGAAARHSIA